MKPICVPCQRFMRPHKTGRRFVEAMPRAGVVRPVPGTSHPEQWTPYKIWVGDEWICHGCGQRTIVGVAGMPLREHYQEGFAELLPSANYLTVNDC